MRIIICVHNLSNGGAERVASLWAKGFVEQGYQVHLVICEANAEVDYEVPESVKFHLVYSNGFKLIKYIKRLFQLRKLIKNIKPDVVIGMLRPWNYWLVFATIGMKVPLITTEHDSFERPFSSPMPKWQKFDKYVWNKLFDGITVLTEADKKLLNGKVNNVFVLPNPLSFKPVDKVNMQKKHIIFAAGRLDNWHCKGFDNLIKAWGKVAAKYPDWTLQIAGNGSSDVKKYLRSFADSCGVGSRTELLGFRHSIVENFKDSEIFVLSSRFEGFGMVLIEAMSQGCACVACDYGGRQAEILEDGVSGLLSTDDDWIALSDKLNLLLGDQALRRRIQQGAVARSRHFELDKIIERWKNIFHLLKIV